MNETYRSEIRICTFNVNLTKARTDLIKGSSQRKKTDLGILVFKRLKLLRRPFLLGPLKNVDLPVLCMGRKATTALRYAQQFPLKTRKGEAFVYEKR